MNDREPAGGPPGGGIRVTRASPNSATRSRARCRSPRNTRSCASESTGPAAPRAHPGSWRRTLGRCPPRSRRTRLRPAPAASGRRTRGPVSAASRTTSPLGRPDDLPADPSPQPNSRSLSDGTESDLSDFVNGLSSEMGPEPSEILLEAGDLLFTPRGFVHDAIATNLGSLHITLGMGPRTWADLLAAIVVEAGQSNEALREAIPPAFLRGVPSQLS